MNKLVIVFALFLFACKNRERVFVSVKDSTKPIAISHGYLLFNSVKHPFSEPDRLDSFVIAVTGDSLLHAAVRFEIFDPAGKSIYLDTFPAMHLAGSYDEESLNSPVKKENFIRKRVRDFFSADKFLEPAVSAADSTDDDYTQDKALWSDLKSNPRSIGFFYLLGEEDGRKIAYSRLKKKVLMYFNCC
ncbi:MAG: hypothetical protein JO301_15770 [Chitinophagaceae bacterium]|nr:hypothetical protein [Chitinophagaceae bacterium]